MRNKLLKHLGPLLDWNTTGKHSKNKGYNLLAAQEMRSGERMCETQNENTQPNTQYTTTIPSQTIEQTDNKHAKTLTPPPGLDLTQDDTNEQH